MSCIIYGSIKIYCIALYCMVKQRSHRLIRRTTSYEIARPSYDFNCFPTSRNALVQPRTTVYDGRTMSYDFHTTVTIIYLHAIF